MGAESKWIKDNMTNIDKGDTVRRIKAVINFKTNANEVLEEVDPITGRYSVLGFTMRELGKTAEVMHGYDGDVTRIYADYFAQAITDKLRTVFDFDVLEEEDYQVAYNYGMLVLEEIDRLSSKNIAYTLEGFYKVFKE
ncbi:MAG: hypothetical protein ACRC41_07090 [Sarcina sp.]